MEFVCKSADATKALAKKISSKITGGQVLALTGQLGSGKTTFVQGLAEGFKIANHLNSPTFLILKEYPIKSLKKKISLCHIDAYRLGKIDDAVEAGITDSLGQKNKICVVEWAEKIKQVIPKNAIWINFEGVNENSRRIIINDFKH